MSLIKLPKGHWIINPREEDSEMFCKEKDAWPDEDYSVGEQQSGKV